MNDNEKSFVTDEPDMLATAIMLGVIVLMSAAIVGFMLYEAWRFGAFLLQ
jgi:hypothetical protein